MAVAAYALLRSASGDAEELKGTVRVTAADLVGAEVLPPILTDFHERNRGVDIELVLSDEQQDLLRRDADIAVRMVRPTQGALFARRIGSVRLTLYAHRAYLARRGRPASLADLSGHAIIGFDRVPPPPRMAERFGVSLAANSSPCAPTTPSRSWRLCGQVSGYPLASRGLRR